MITLATFILHLLSSVSATLQDLDHRQRIRRFAAKRSASAYRSRRPRSSQHTAGPYGKPRKKLEESWKTLAEITERLESIAHARRDVEFGGTPGKSGTLKAQGVLWLSRSQEACVWSGQPSI